MTQAQTAVNLPNGVEGVALGQQAADSTPSGVQTQAPETKEPAVQKTPREKLEAQIATLEKRIEKDTAALAELTAKRDVIDILAAVDVGYGVTIKVGRADTATTVQGVVTGVNRDNPDSPRYKVYYGSGFDAETVVIQQHQIISAVKPA